MLALTPRELPSGVGNRLCIEHEIILFKQAGDTRLVDLHLEVAHAQGSNCRGPLSLHAVVVHLDAFDAERRDYVEIDSNPQAGTPRPGVARDEIDPRPGQR